MGLDIIQPLNMINCVKISLTQIGYDLLPSLILTVSICLSFFSFFLYVDMNNQVNLYHLLIINNMIFRNKKLFI